jgi:hypothetical protein
VFLSKVSQNEVAPALRMLLPDDQKGSSGDEKSTMTTSAPRKKQKHAITSNQNDANHNNSAQNRPKSCPKQQIKQKKFLHTYRKNSISEESCSCPKLRKVKSIPHRLSRYLMIAKGQVETKNQR